MVLSTKQKRKIIQTALQYIGTPYSKEFDCIQFVRVVYKSAGIIVPKIFHLTPPPEEFNIKKRQLQRIPKGHLIFLKDRYDPRKERYWTHVVIALDNRRCIHNSIFYGSEKVTISNLGEIMRDRYNFAESVPPP